MTNYKVEVECDSEVNELFAKTKVIQKLKNEESNPLELKVFVYKKVGIIFSSFIAQIGDSIKVKSKVIKKEKAENKYTDAISKGNAAIYVYEEYDRIVINMGNIPPNQEITLISNFIQLVETYKTYEFELFRNLPIFYGKNIFPNSNLKGKLQIKTKNNIIKIEKEILESKLKIIKENYLENEKNNYMIQYQIISDLNKNESYYYSNDEYIKSSKIYFYIEDIRKNEPIIYYQKSILNKNENNYIINYINKQKNFDETNPALFIFLIDQSYSMSGDSIHIVSKALELFLQSLPVDSYYQIIGFGSHFKKYDETPKEYTKTNIENSLKIIKTLDADLGGTNIYDPLKDIYTNEQQYDEIKLPKNIFLLTDGEIENKSETLELIEKNSSKFSIFSIGIGDSFDEDLIKNAGIIGKGGFNFCYNLEELNSVIVNEIKKSISPYITNINIETSLDENNIYKVCEIPKILRNNQIVNIGYIVESNGVDNDDKINKINIKMNYLEDNNIKVNNNYEIIPEEIEKGDEISKLIINNYLSKNLDEIEKIQLSLKYQILAEYTSLFSEVELSNKISEEMKSKIIGEKKSIPSETISDNEKIKYINKIVSEGKEKIEELLNDRYMCLSRECMRCKSLGESGIKRSKNKNFSFKFWNCCKKRTKMKIDDLDEDSTKENKNIKNDISITDFEQNNEIYDKDSKVRINVNEIYDKDSKVRINVNEKKNEKRKNDIMNMVNTQDFIEGFWEYNEQTKYVKEKYEKEYDLLIKNGNINEKIAMTILIIYYLEEECSELLNELSLIIIKAKKYIQKEAKSTYDDIILNVTKLK